MILMMWTFIDRYSASLHIYLRIVWLLSITALSEYCDTTSTVNFRECPPSL